MDIRIGNTTQASTPYAERGVSTAPPAAVSKKAAADPVQENADVQQPKPVPSEDQVSQALKSINNVLQSRSQDLEFSVDSASERTIVKVVDKNTQEVIRQMPTQEALDIAKALDKLHSLLIRQTA
jgi:flagellar protein FlaG